MKSLGYDELHTVPRDIVAKRVLFDAGDQYKSKVKGNGVLFSTTPLPIREMKDIPYKIKNDPSFKDFTGFKFGNFTVVGLFYLHKFDKWVVKCCCGNYEIRRTYVLKKNPTEIDQTRCLECIDLERIRHKDYLKKHGQYPWQKIKANKR